MLQAWICTKLLEKELDLARKEDESGKIGVFFCGDMNSTPPCGVPNLMLNGRIEPDHPEWRSCEGEEVKTGYVSLELVHVCKSFRGLSIQVSGITLSHPFSMGSACGFPKYTNFTSGFADCLDYIFYDKDR